MSTGNPSDPMEFLRNLWGGNGFSLPGMVTPTLDTDELEKQIRDLKTVEGWLRTNLSMLSMTIQNLEMQRTTITAVKTMSQMYADQTAGTPPPAAAENGDTLAQAAMWPWNMMQQMQETMKQAATEAGNVATEAAKAGVARATSAAAAAAEAAGDAKTAAGRRKKTS